jgi:hypothetical protein
MSFGPGAPPGPRLAGTTQRKPAHAAGVPLPRMPNRHAAPALAAGGASAAAAAARAAQARRQREDDARTLQAVLAGPSPVKPPPAGRARSVGGGGGTRAGGDATAFARALAAAGVRAAGAAAAPPTATAAAAASSPTRTAALPLGGGRPCVSVRPLQPLARAGGGLGGGGISNASSAAPAARVAAAVSSGSQELIREILRGSRSTTSAATPAVPLLVTTGIPPAGPGAAQPRRTSSVALAPLLRGAPVATASSSPSASLSPLSYLDRLLALSSQVEGAGTPLAPAPAAAAATVAAAPATPPSKRRAPVSHAAPRLPSPLGPSYQRSAAVAAPAAADAVAAPDWDRQLLQPAAALTGVGDEQPLHDSRGLHSLRSLWLGDGAAAALARLPAPDDGGGDDEAGQARLDLPSPVARVLFRRGRQQHQQPLQPSPPATPERQMESTVLSAGDDGATVARAAEDDARALLSSPTTRLVHDLLAQLASAGGGDGNGDGERGGDDATSSVARGRLVAHYK